jgi:GNAT superfamily N-acetyltransferase
MNSTRDTCAIGAHIREGTLKDYIGLARHHYRGSRPALIERIMVAERGGETLGVLVLSRPTLNAPWRKRAWPGPQWDNARAAAEYINAHVRRIARVIVDPRARGMGVGLALVRACLAQREGELTETVAAMAWWSPLFSRCGMREIEPTEPKRMREFKAALATAGIEPWELMDAAATARLLAGDIGFRRAVRRWAQGSRHSRQSLNDDSQLVREVIYAASQMTRPARVYVSP